MLSLLAETVINITDTAFLGHVGEVELGAAAIGGIFYFTIAMLSFGFTAGVQILVARRYGEKDYKATGDLFNNSVYFLAALSLLITLVVLLFSSSILKPFIASHDIFVATIKFLNYRTLGLFFASGLFLFRAFYTGIAFTKYISVATISTAVINIFLAYGFIFGHFGIPQMGIAGAGLASSISEACGLIIFAVITVQRVDIQKYNLFKFVKPDFTSIYKILEVSVYVMIQYFLSHVVWFIFFLLIEKMGELSLAVSNIIRSIYIILLIPVWALGSTTSSLVSASIGEGLKERVIPIVRKVTGFNMLIMAAMALLIFFIPKFLISIYTSDPQLIQASIPSYYMIIGAAFVFSTSVIAFNGVLGTGNTNVGMVIEIITLAIYLVTVWVLAHVLKLPIEIVWICEYVYGIFMILFSWLYLAKGKWAKKTI